MQKKLQRYIKELGSQPEKYKITENKKFIQQFQTAILLTLLTDKELTKRQFELCIDKLEKQHLP